MPELHRVKLTATLPRRRWRGGQIRTTIATAWLILPIEYGLFHAHEIPARALRCCCCRRIAQAADITGVPKIREGDQIQIGTSRIRLGGIDAPSVDQLCLNNTGERWTCGVAARDELIKHVDNKSWTCHVRQHRPPRPAWWRAARSTARTSRNGW